MQLLPFSSTTAMFDFISFMSKCLNVYISVLKSSQRLKARILCILCCLCQIDYCQCSLFNVSDVNCCHYHSGLYFKKMFFVKSNKFFCWEFFFLFPTCFVLGTYEILGLKLIKWKFLMSRDLTYGNFGYPPKKIMKYF